MPRLPHVSDTTRRLLSHVCEQVDWLERRSEMGENLRAAAVVLEAAAFLQTEDRSQGLAVATLLEPLVGPGTSVAPERLPLLTELQQHVHALLDQPTAAAAPWSEVSVPAEVLAVPTMLTRRTMRYYTWLGAQLPPRPRIAELGSWLGSSTRCLCAGLAAPGRDPGAASVDVYDSFTWAGWMDQHLPLRADLARPRPGESFLAMFEADVAGVATPVVSHPCWIDDRSAPDELPSWPHEEPIDLLVYDMGPDRRVLELLWSIFSPHVQPGVTVLVFNEYGKVHAGEIWEFCDAQASRLQPLHKPAGTAKAFRCV